MTSGQFTSFPIDSIVVNREDRQRRELTGIDEMAWSLKTVGQIHPIIISRDGVLRTGERRFTAAKQLGWTHINIQFVDELDDTQLTLLELEENIRRVDLSWQDQCAAVAKYHNLRASLEEDWTHEKTAEALGSSRQDVSAKLQIIKEIEGGNEMVATADRYSTAKGIVQRATERRKASTVATLTPAVKELQEKTVPLKNLDFILWTKDYTGPKFNFIHCDFPYGVDADKHNQGAAKSMGGYEDGFEVYASLLKTLGEAMSTVVADSAHLMFWFSMDYYEYTRKTLTDIGWEVNPFPLIWHKNDNTGILPDPKRGPRRIYETAFHASRGDRLIVRSVSNVVSAPVTKEIHMSEKNYSMLLKFMEMFVDEHTVGLDPTCGSGNAVRAMEERGASYFLGLEKNTEFFNLAKEHYYGKK